jgi:hypothetical protein
MTNTASCAVDDAEQVAVMAAQEGTGGGATGLGVDDGRDDGDAEGLSKGDGLGLATGDGVGLE